MHRATGAPVIHACAEWIRVDVECRCCGHTHRLLSILGDTTGRRHSDRLNGRVGGGGGSNSASNVVGSGDSFPGAFTADKSSWRGRYNLTTLTKHILAGNGCLARSSVWIQAIHTMLQSTRNTTPAAAIGYVFSEPDWRGWRRFWLQANVTM
jgi:hypothetical protein